MTDGIAAPAEGAGRLGSRSSIPWGVVGLVALIGAVETFVAYHSQPWESQLGRSWTFSARAAVGPARSGEVLYFGDSQGKLGILPRVVERMTGLTGYNLSVLRGMPISSVGLLKKALNAGARPKAVVVDFNPGLLATQPRLNAPLWHVVLSPADRLRLAARSRDPGQAIKMLVAPWFPTWEARQGIRQAVLMRLTGVEGELLRTGREVQATWKKEAGAQPIPVDLRFQDERFAVEAVPPGKEWRSHPVQERYVHEFMDVAASRGVPVFWVIPPLSPSLQGKRLRNGQEAEYSRLVARVLERHPGLTVVDARRLDMDRLSFVDQVHLSAPGATKLSARLARVLASTLKTPRPNSTAWFEILPGGDRPFDTGTIRVAREPSRQVR